MLPRRGIGAPLIIIGVLGFILGPTLGSSELGRPWSFLVGFGFGVMTGFGTALTLKSLISSRQSR